MADGNFFKIKDVVAIKREIYKHVFRSSNVRTGAIIVIGKRSHWMLKTKL